MSVQDSSVQSVRPLLKNIINPALADHIPREAVRFKGELACWKGSLKRWSNR